MTVNRIINPFLNKEQRHNLYPVLLHHGYQNQGSAWLINSKGKLSSNGEYIEFDEDGNQLNGSIGNTLGFVLATQGYDVWLANYRGGSYCLNHTKLNPEKGKLN